MTQLIGIDFGTTNSVLAKLETDGSVTTTRYAVGSREVDTFRTVLCFWNEHEKGRSRLCHAAGPYAVENYLNDPTDSRLIMSMKTYLAQHSFSRTNIFGKIFTLEDMIASFLDGLFQGEKPEAHIVAGRPVRFAGDLADDAFGESRLRASFAQAGYPQIDVALEPEAAGYRFARTLTEPATVLVGDFGGGTSDFSVIRFDPRNSRGVKPLGYSGVGIAGDTFDYRIIDNVVSPLLGKGDTYSVMGTDLPVPPEYFSGFARWHRLSLMKAPRTLRAIEEVAAASHNPDKLRMLVRLIEDELGYQLYQTVSAVKAELSRSETATLRFAHGDLAIERTIARHEFEAWIAPDLARMSASVDQALAAAGLRPDEIDRVFLTGGTSFVPAVRGLFETRFGAERVSGGGEFVSVAEGLALIGRDRAENGLLALA
ncbi:Hsp70 family protein [Acidisoma silvae]|uniref:Hsp70 family protein n=1 Tax=Acidisoma silvae TaxID=2802396 RepID=A0A963YQX3_9PROT|nr:Hsp70 family protein [Acidisoma silvae]MCB8875019.1 Hsp70 family protein [Acidisoma silvae]